MLQISRQAVRREVVYTGTIQLGRGLGVDEYICIHVLKDWHLTYCLQLYVATSTALMLVGMGTVRGYPDHCQITLATGFVGNTSPIEDQLSDRSPFVCSDAGA